MQVLADMFSPNISTIPDIHSRLYTVTYIKWRISAEKEKSLQIRDIHACNVAASSLKLLSYCAACLPIFNLLILLYCAIHVDFQMKTNSVDVKEECMTGGKKVFTNIFAGSRPCSCNENTMLCKQAMSLAISFASSIGIRLACHRQSSVYPVNARRCRWFRGSDSALAFRALEETGDWTFRL
jgi:hypothetical protein